MNGTKIILKFDGAVIAASKSATVTLNQDADEYSPLPGSSQDDGWAYYRPGRLSWNLGNEGFFTDASKTQIDAIIPQVDKGFNTLILIDTLRFQGVVRCEKLSIKMPTGNLCKLDVDFIGEDFPELL